MTDIEILKKAIEKARLNSIENGICKVNVYKWRNKIDNPSSFIFSHDFAKAFWGEEDLCDDCGENADDNYEDGICKNCHEDLSSDSNGFGDMNDSPAWKYHLRIMVLEENPIKYLEQFI